MGKNNHLKGRKHSTWIHDPFSNYNVQYSEKGDSYDDRTLAHRLTTVGHLLSYICVPGTVNVINTTWKGNFTKTLWYLKYMADI